MDTSLARDFFKLEGDFAEVDETAFVAHIESGLKLCKDWLYRPDTLKNKYPSGRQRVKGITFRNVSFSRTRIVGFEFTNGIFERCLLLSTTFEDCRFTSCKFFDCNPYRLEFEKCYVDPESFAHCIIDISYSNIGVYLFQELLRNSRQQAQPDFSDGAQYLFRKWQRNQLRQELVGGDGVLGNWRTRLRLVHLGAFEFISGSGVRLGKLMRLALIILIFFTLVNWLFANQLGLIQENKPFAFVDALYFSSVIATTLGFGDIAPITPLGRIVVSAQAIVGFVLFALVTSTLYRKFSS